MNRIEDYVRQTYKKRFKDKPVFITEGEVCYFVTENMDTSPLILSKNI